MSDPRVFFAAERTLLAWVRTGLTVMGFGFVVARFGVFLRLLAVQHSPALASSSAVHYFSTGVGVSLVLLAAVILFFTALQHRAFVRGLPEADRPRSHSSMFPLTVAITLGTLGLALAIYLVA
jgi:putative membrane protein